MRLLLLTTYCLVACLALAGCSLFFADDGAEGDYEDVYRYTASDAAGETVVTGTLYLVYVPSDVMNEPDLLQGRWRLDAAENTGPQDGEGLLEGTDENDVLSINLNPGVADDNVFLHGAFEDDRARMAGEWSYATLVGPVAGGAFEAVRRHRARRQYVAG